MEDNADVVMVAKLECTAWAIWHNRNATRYGGKQRTGKEVVSDSVGKRSTLRNLQKQMLAWRAQLQCLKSRVHGSHLQVMFSR